MLSSRAASLCVIFAFIGVCFAQPATLYVGSQQQFTTISAAVANASDGDLIILQNETFSGDGNVLVDLTGKSISIFGSGSSIIDGLHNGPIFFLNATDTNHTIVISLLTIRNAFSAEKGGAISFQGHPGLSLTVDTVVFSNNKGAHAGAIAVEEGGQTSTVVVTGSTFQNNNGSRGGAICVRNSTLFVDQSSFTQNRAGRGGAIFADTNSVAQITNSAFFNNTAYANGGAFYQAAPSTIYANAITVQSNTAACPNCTRVSESFGGAWYLSGNTTVAYVSDSSFSFNSATNGGVFAVSQNAVAQLVNSTFDSNSVTLYGGVLYVDTAAISVDSSNFTNNQADGGAVSYIILATQVNVTNSSFSNNMATDFAGAFFCQDSHLSVSSLTLASNSNGDFYCGPQCFADGYCPASSSECQAEKDYVYNLTIVAIVMALLVAQLGTFLVYWLAGQAQQLNAGSTAAVKMSS